MTYYRVPLVLTKYLHLPDLIPPRPSGRPYTNTNLPRPATHLIGYKIVIGLKIKVYDFYFTNEGVCLISAYRKQAADQFFNTHDTLAVFGELVEPFRPFSLRRFSNILNNFSLYV